MLRFFRTLRHKFLEEGHFRKYFWYALGEILLVMIGILLALQVNNWNEERKDRNLEQVILKNLHREILANMEELERDHTLNERALNALLELMDTDKRQFYTPETIDSLIGKAYNFATFDARTGVIDEIITSGSLSLIKNDSLKYMISLWSGEMGDLAEDAIIRRDYWIHNVSPLIRKFIPIRNIDEINTRSDYDRTLVIKPIEVSADNYQRFINSLEVDGALYDSYMNQSFVYINEENIEQYLDRFLQLVEENIDD